VKPVAVVTGASGGLGTAIAAELEGRGYEVVGLSRSTGVDVSDEKGVEAAFSGLERLDALVNNAAVLVNKPLLETTAEEWDLQLGSGLRSAFLCSREAFRRMRDGGCIVNVSSLSGVLGAEKFAGMAGYVDRGSHVYADGFDEQRIAFPMPNRISHVSWFRILGQRTPVGVNLARRVENLRQHHDLVGRLNDLKGLN